MKERLPFGARRTFRRTSRSPVVRITAGRGTGTPATRVAASDPRSDRHDGRAVRGPAESFAAPHPGDGKSRAARGDHAGDAGTSAAGPSLHTRVCPRAERLTGSAPP